MKCNEHLAKIGSICCQKIIPLVFDQSYSYYEQLCAFATKLNEIICAVNEQNLTIADFENRINMAFNQYKSEINLAFADFQIEVNQKIDEFTTEIRDEWRIYRETLNLEFTELKNANQHFKEDMQTAWSAYQTQINSTISNFMTAETTARTNFETAQTQRQTDFETAQTTRQTNYETNLTNDWEEFQTEIETALSTVSSKERLSYYGALRPVSAGSSTDWPFIDNPIDSVQGLNFANNLVSVYMHNATAHNYTFLKRQKYGALATDGDLPTPSRSSPVLIVFDNPVANLFFAYGADLTFTGSGVDGSGDNRLIIGAFPRVSNTMAFTDTGYTALAEYSAHGITDHTLTPRSTPYPPQPSYYAIAFLFSGVNYGVTVAQPTTAATQRRIMPGLLYDAFTGEFMRDPALADFVANVLPYVLQRGEYTLNDQSELTFDTLSESKYYRYTASAIGNPVPGGYGIIVNIRFTAYAVQLLFSQTTATTPTQLLYRLGTDMNTTPNWRAWQTVSTGGGGATIKTLTYTGDGGNTTTINFPEAPYVILSIDGPGVGTGMVNLTSFRFGAKAVCGSWSDLNASTKSGTIALVANTSGNTLLLSFGANAGSRCNVNGESYTVTYI